MPAGLPAKLLDRYRLRMKTSRFCRTAFAAALGLVAAGCGRSVDADARQYAASLAPFADAASDLRDAITRGSPIHEILKKGLAADLALSAAKKPAVESAAGKRLFERAHLVNEWADLIANNSNGAIRAGGDSRSWGAELSRAAKECKNECETLLREYDAAK